MTTPEQDDPEKDRNFVTALARGLELPRRHGAHQGAQQARHQNRRQGGKEHSSPFVELANRFRALNQHRHPHGAIGQRSAQAGEHQQRQDQQTTAPGQSIDKPRQYTGAQQRGR